MEISTIPELAILFINFTLIVFAYFLIYPRFVKDNTARLIKFDIIISLFALFLAGVLFYGSGTSFNFIFFDGNWFWFSLLTFAILEMFYFFSYIKRFQISLESGNMPYDTDAEDLKKEGETFNYALNNFENIFAENLTPTKENSVDIFFVEIVKEFVGKLRKEVDFEKLENLDNEASFIEVTDDGLARIYLPHKKDLGLQLNGIEIFITDKITIDFFYEAHEHFVVSGNKKYFIDSKKVNKEEKEKWKYSEIDEAVRVLKNSLNGITKISRVTWKGHLLSSGILDEREKKISTTHLFRPIIFIKRLFQPWIQKKEEIISVKW